MEKFKKYFQLCTMALAVGCMFTACGDDDDEGGNGDWNSGGTSQSAVSSAITTENGEKVLLTSVGERWDKTTFSYDEEGRCTSYDYYEESVFFSYNPFTIEYSSEYEDEEIVYSGTLNAQGFISSITEKYNYHGYESGESTMYYSYDKSGHLVKIIGEGTETEDGETYPWNIDYDLIWSNGNLVKIFITGSDSEESWTATSEIVYGNQVNKYNQYTVALAYTIDTELMEHLCLVGLMGKGSNYLPTQITHKESDDDDEYKSTYTYELNENGTIAAEIEIEEWGDNRTDYVYSALGETPAPKMQQNGTPKAKKYQPLFKRIFSKHTNK